MLSKNTAKELEGILDEEGNCVVEVQSPTGQQFSVVLQQGRADQIRQNRAYQDEPGQRGRQQQQRTAAQEWIFRKIPTQEQQG
jgi:hypothetical protein